jgi:hypothetical protein
VTVVLASRRLAYQKRSWPCKPPTWERSYEPRRLHVCGAVTSRSLEERIGSGGYGENRAGACRVIRLNTEGAERATRRVEPAWVR